MIKVEIIDEQAYLNEARKQMMKDIIQLGADIIGNKDDCELDISIVDEFEIHRLNRDYRHIDRPTDVLSFALEETGVGEEAFPMATSAIARFPRQLGDIVICYQKIEEQATEYGHGFDRELAFLTIHGFLHLNGYDHQTPEEEATMFSIQEKVLQDYGLFR